MMSFQMGLTKESQFGFFSTVEDDEVVVVEVRDYSGTNESSFRFFSTCKDDEAEVQPMIEVTDRKCVVAEQVGEIEVLYVGKETSVSSCRSHLVASVAALMVLISFKAQNFDKPMAVHLYRHQCGLSHESCSRFELRNNCT